MTMTMDQYKAWLQEQDDLQELRGECIERMEVNVGLIAENTALKKRIQPLEAGNQ